MAGADTRATEGEIDRIRSLGLEETGWLPHTARAALTGLRKRGFTVERIRHKTHGSLPDHESSRLRSGLIP
jgi:Protein of unknown function (DUF3489)